MTCRSWLKLRLGVMALAMMAMPPAWAGVISLEVQSRPTVHEGRLTLSIDITNQGDEPAYNVKVEVELQGDTWVSPVRESLPVATPQTVSYQRSLEGLAKGSYPVIVRILYTDAQRYPFSALAVSQVTVGEDVAPSVWAVLEAGQLWREGTLTLRLKNLESTPQTVSVRLVLPQELSAQPFPPRRTLGPSAEDTVSVRLRNFSARTESTYPVYALIEHDRGGVHQTVVSTTALHVVSTSANQPSQTLWLVLAGGLLLVIVILNVRGARPTS